MEHPDFANLIVLDFPEGAEFGIDMKFWNVGTRFRGITGIPPGFHFVYFSSGNTEYGVSYLRSGFFKEFKGGKTYVYEWQATKEELVEAGESAQERVHLNLREIQAFLGPYPSDQLKKWVSLSKYVTSELVAKITPPSGQIRSATQLLPCDAFSSSRNDSKVISQSSQSHNTTQPGSYQEAMNRLPKMVSDPHEAIGFSTINLRSSSTHPADITQAGIDTSAALQNFLHSNYSQNPLYILGELQIAFLCFLVGQNYDAFEHWKRLISLICQCDALLKTHSKLFTIFIMVLHFQLKEIPKDFFIDIMSANNFLTTTLQIFFSNVEAGSGRLGESDGAEMEELRLRADRFRTHLTGQFKWDFRQEPEDWAPTVVES